MNYSTNTIHLSTTNPFDGKNPSSDFSVLHLFKGKGVSQLLFFSGLKKKDNEETPPFWVESFI